MAAEAATARRAVRRWASPRTPSSLGHPSDGRASSTPRSSSTPDGEVDQPLREGADRAVRRVRAVARRARGARGPARPGAERRRRRAAIRPSVELPDGTRLGVMISWEVFFGGRGRRRPPATAPATRRSCSTPPTGRATPAPSCRPSRSRRASCGRWRTGAGWCRCRRPASRRSSTPTATSTSAPTSASSAVITMDVPLRGGTHLVSRRSATGRGSSAAGGAAGGLDLVRAIDPTASQLQHQRDRAVVDELDLHLGAEPAGGHRARPSCRSRSTTASTSGSACSGRAASIQLGRRPLSVLPYSVNWLTTSTSRRLPVGGEIGERPVHHPVGVVEDPQVPDLVGQLVGDRRRCRRG